MPDTAIIVKAITAMHSSFDESLDKVYTEIKGCNSRVTEIEIALAIKRGICKEKEKREKQDQEKVKETRTFWRSILRAVSVVGILSLCALIYERMVALWGFLWETLP
jgi:anti-sigma-K factor RskA